MIPGGFASHEAALSHLAAVVAGSSDAIVSKTLEGVVQSWNPAAETLFGYSAGEMLGTSIRRLIPQDRQAEEDEFLARLGRGEQIRGVVTERLRSDGTSVSVVLTISPIRDHTGKIVGASKIVRELSDERKALEKLRESDERFRTLADNISQFAWMAEPDGHIFWYNARWYDYTGTTLPEMQGWGWRKVHHPDHVDRVVERIQRSWDTGEPWEDTFPLRGADGQYRWFLSRALPIRDASGSIVRWFGTNTDISEQRRREEHIELLMNEVNHRAKNVLALVQAMARQTASGKEERAFADRFSVRLQALAASQDVLVKSGWRGGDAESLIRSQLSHFADLVGKRIHLHGAPLSLTTAAVQVLGMSLHELATNAGKYGALSMEGGEVNISWCNDVTTGRFMIEWKELLGPPVTPPSRSGFGKIVIERMSRMALDAETSTEFLPQGVVWRLECANHMAVMAPESEL